MTSSRGHSNDPKRLVKVWLPVNLVRRMDSAILASGGAYVDRTDFMAEGALALLDELRHEVPEKATPQQKTPTMVDHGKEDGSPPQAAWRFGDWVDADVSTLPATPGPKTNFGLHNRDLPTLWSLDFLGRLVADEGKPVAWAQLNGALLPAAWEEARRLRAHMQNRTDIKTEAGFPTQVKKREASERRFLTHFAGTSQNRGPWFVFRLVGVEDGLVAPTTAAVQLIRALGEENIASAPPFSEAAWKIFRAHLEREAPEELRLWLEVLEILSEEPTRGEVASRCSWWSGSQAETNSSSLVARGREWGLVDQSLHDRRYKLTDLGRRALEATSKAGRSG